MDRPEIFETPYGNLNYDENYHWYEDDLKIGDRIIYFNFDEPESEADEAIWEILEQVVSNLDAYDQKCRKHAAVELLEGANDWLDSSDDENKPECYTEEMFMSLMELESIFINPDGSLEFGYADGDMFWGHSIMVNVEPDGECSYADIAG